MEQTILTTEQAIERLKELGYYIQLTDDYIMVSMQGHAFNIPFVMIKHIEETDPTMTFWCYPYCITLYKRVKASHITNFWES